VTSTQQSPASDASSSLLPILGWLSCAVFFFYAWVMRVAPSVMVEELMRDFAVGAGVLGHLSAAYFYGYAGMQIPVGLMIDRFGPRRLTTIAAAICAVGCVLFAYAASLTTATAGRFLIGASAAFSLVSAMAVAGQWFKPDRFALLSGLAMAFGMAGGVFGQAPLRFVIESSHWRTANLLLAAGGIALCIACWLTVRDRWRGTGGIGQAFSGLATVVKHRQTLLIALAGLGTSAPLLGFAALWGVPFLEAAYGFSRASAAATTSILFIGWAFGAPLIGWVSDRIGKRLLPLVVSLVLQTAGFTALVYIPDLSTTAITTLCFLIGLFGGGQITCFALVKDNHPANLSGSAIGFLNGTVTGAGALFQPLVGMLLDMAWAGQIVNGARVYDGAAFRFAFLSIVACGVIGILSLLAVREPAKAAVEARAPAAG
jgi:MFS family permease